MHSQSLKTISSYTKMINNMNKKYCILYMLGMLSLTSCVTDEGNNDIQAINEAKIEGIDDSYYKVAEIETLEIPVQVSGTLSGDDMSRYDFEWFLCESDIGNSVHEHTVISRDKDLVYPLKDIKPGTYDIYFRATDKDTKLVFEKECQLNVISPYVRGFYLYGDKEDGTVGIDFVSMLENRDTTVIADVFDNTKGIKHAKNLLFTGTYRQDLEGLWAVTADDTYRLTYSSSNTKVSFSDNDFNDCVWPTIASVKKPFKVQDIVPHPYGPDNNMLARSWRCVLTDKAMFFGTLYSGENYGNPSNCKVAGSEDLIDIAPYAFYQGNQRTVSMICFFDRTNHKFVRLSSTYSNTNNLVDYTETSETPFSVDQTKYTPVRDLVYGENGYGNSGASYALMNDADGNYYVYMFRIETVRYQPAFTKSLVKTVDRGAAVDIDKATHYAFYSQQSILLYSVGNDLWAYNYNTGKAAKVKSFDGEITYMASDFHSAGNTDDIVVATWSPSEKGTVYKFEIEDSPNDLKLNDKHYETQSYPWKTNLKVVKVEYRNCSN